MSGPFTVAIDGPAASGKGTIARAVAAHFGYEHLDTGLLYRAVGARMLEGEDPVEAAEALVQADLERPNLRGAAVAEAASKVAVLEPVRKALLDYQRAFARRAGGAVLDGRDIGTVICPEAEAKLFVTASAEARAGRRYREMAASGIDTTEEAVLADVLSRDARDRDRAHAPMCAADDALMLDTTEMNIDEAVTQAIAHIVSRQRN
ncbi:(d)CMP kinase [Chachezhania antarctica]|uniref:(d)CMP kinase n=1 Tax=Chachezhania antarctica TaxID=2340860 RepID=UPI000EB35D96|nr:d(CMP) kinase [Chachezhania antarctica]|tara:strand:+ start:1987 stop:2604 length:618 start_codon:yes stop_codon:yes gene_type:complete